MVRRLALIGVRLLPVLVCATVAVGCGGSASVGVQAPPTPPPAGPGVSGVVFLPNGQLSQQTSSVFERLAALVVNQAAALTGNVSHVGRGVEVRLTRLLSNGIAQPGSFSTFTNDQGQFTIPLPSRTTADTSRFMVSAGNTRAFVYSSSEPIDVDFASEAAVSLILARVAQGTDLSRYSSDDIRRIVTAIRLSPGAVVGATAQEINTNALALAAADAAVQAAVAAPIATLTPTLTRVPVATSTRTNTPTNTLRPTNTATHVPTSTPVRTSTPSPTLAPSHTPTPTRTAPSTSTATGSPTHTAPQTATATSTATDTPEPSPTATASHTPSATGTSTQTLTLTATGSPTQTRTTTPTPSVTVTPKPAVCGDELTDLAAGEECDDGGTCIGGDNAGTHCTAEEQCSGSGICTAGPRIDANCAIDADCPSGKCIHCKPLGGDGCAANCTHETDVPYVLVPGAPLGNPASTTSFGFVHTGSFVQIALPLTGQQILTIGKLRDGIIPVTIKTANLTLPAARAASIACACVRPISFKTCGGTVLEADGITQTQDCTPDFTAGDSECAGKKPCTFVHGPNNTASGIIGCNGLEGINLNFTQDAGGMAPPPTPTPNSAAGDPMFTLSGSGGPGSAVIAVSVAVGITTAAPGGNKCVSSTPVDDLGADMMFCTSDDPQSARGSIVPVPLITGVAMGTVLNSGSPGHNVGPFSLTGAKFSCPALTSPTPSVTGIDLVGTFTILNAEIIGDAVGTLNLVAQ